MKLDLSLIERVGDGAAMRRSWCEGLIGTARAFDLEILAEGIERAEQAHFLMSHDCQKVQGYLFGRPARAIDLGCDHRQGHAERRR